MGRLGMGRLSPGMGVAKYLHFFKIIFRMCCRLAFNAAFDIMIDSNLSPIAYVSDGIGQCDGFRGTAAGKNSAAIHADRLRGTARAVRHADRLRGTARAVSPGNSETVMQCSSTGTERTGRVGQRVTR